MKQTIITITVAIALITASILIYANSTDNKSDTTKLTICTALLRAGSTNYQSKRNIVAYTLPFHTRKTDDNRELFIDFVQRSKYEIEKSKRTMMLLDGECISVNEEISESDIHFTHELAANRIILKHNRPTRYKESMKVGQPIL